MIISRSPLRISLGGGGTDLPSYYEKYGGFLVSAAINKYVYITVYDSFTNDLVVKYSKLEKVKHANQLEHPIFREAFDMVGLTGKYMELTSFAHVPSGTGMGSSGSFTTALLKALHAFRRNIIGPEELAKQACEIEIQRLKEPIGKQDQYIAAFGGITCFTFNKDGTVAVRPLRISEDVLHDLEENLLLFFTGYSRSASAILKHQKEKSEGEDKKMIENLHFIKDLGMKSAKALEEGSLKDFAKLMEVHWEYKKKRSPKMSNGNINRWHDIGIRNGALGGKLIGAGGGGFLLFYANDRAKLRHAMKKAGLREMHFDFDFEGTKLL